jgi:hypothetical protein
MLAQLAARLRAGETVEWRPTGNSMTPIIESGQLEVVAPVDPATIGRGDVVLAKVGGRYYLHKVSAVQPGRVQISNNHGHVNGWTSRDQVYGVVTAVAGRPLRRRPGAAATEATGDREPSTRRAGGV